MDMKVCCSLNPAMADSVPGADYAKSVYLKMAASDPGSVVYPGNSAGAAGNNFDPRVVMARPDKMAACQKLIGTAACSPDPANGYVRNNCCSTGTAFVFSNIPTPSTGAYDPSTRDQGEIDRAVAARNASGCTPVSWIGSIKPGANPAQLTKSDPFHLQCKDPASLQKCVQSLGGDIRPSRSECVAPHGFPGSPYKEHACCEMDPSKVIKIVVPPTPAGPIILAPYGRKSDTSGGRPPPIKKPGQ